LYLAILISKISAKRPIDRRGKLHLVSTAVATGALDVATPGGCRLALLDSVFTLPQLNQNTIIGNFEGERRRKLRVNY
jgi:hypothetical protein